MTRGRLLIVCGLPGSGKTTLARTLERERRAVRLCPDEWMATLSIDLYSPPRAHVEALQWQLAERLLELGQCVVVEWGTWGRAERDVLRKRARALGAAVELHHLDASLDVLWQRVRRRRLEQRDGSRALTRENLERCMALFDPPDEVEQALYDRPED